MATDLQMLVESTKFNADETRMKRDELPRCSMSLINAPCTSASLARHNLLSIICVASQ